MHKEEIMGCQKSRIKWICEGDENTTFFHASLRCKKKLKALKYLSTSEVCGIFSAAFIDVGSVSRGPGMNLLSPVIFEAENSSLCRAPELIEIKEAIWSIPQDSSLGPDGFSIMHGILSKMIY